MWTTPAATEMRFGFEVTMYVMNMTNGGFENSGGGMSRQRYDDCVEHHRPLILQLNSPMRI